MRSRLKTVSPMFCLLPMLWLAGCVTSSPDPDYLLLSAGNVEPGSQPAPRILIGPVKLPDFMLRNQLLLRMDENQLRYDTRYRWAEPLDLGVQRVIAHRLSASLDSYGVVSFPSAPVGGVDWRINITLRRFESTGNEVRMVADTHVSPGGDEDTGEVRTLRFEQSRSLDEPGGPMIAQGMSRLLADFVDSIEAEIRRMTATPGADTAND